MEESNILITNEQNENTINISKENESNIIITKEEEETILNLKNENVENTINITNQENEKQIQAEKENVIIGGGSGIIYQAGENIKIENNKISVITTNEMEQDNTKPITSAGVYITVGNINELLKTI